MQNQQFIKTKLNGTVQKNYIASLSSAVANHSSISDPVTITVYSNRIMSNSQVFIGYYYSNTWYCDDDTTITGIQIGSKIYAVGETLNFSDYDNSNIFYVLLSRPTPGATLKVDYNGSTIKTVTTSKTTTLKTAGKFLTGNITLDLTIT